MSHVALLQCVDAGQAHFLGITAMHHTAWCMANRTEYIHSVKPHGIEHQGNPHYLKVMAMLSYIRRRKPEDIGVWLDADAAIVHTQFDWREALPPDFDMGMVRCQNKEHFNTGVIVFRCNERVKTLLEMTYRHSLDSHSLWMAQRVSGYEGYHDQAIINWLIETENVATCTEIPRRYNDYAFALRDRTEKPYVLAWHGSRPRACVARKLANAISLPEAAVKELQHERCQ